MARGRKPEPLALRRLRGNTGHRRMPDPDTEPKPDPTMPTCPTWLPVGAKAVWKEVAPQLHKTGVLTMIDRLALAQFCCLHARWKEAEKMMGKEGIDSDWERVSRQAFLQMRQLEAEFGMTPSSRCKITIAKPADTEDPLEKLLKFKE